MPADYDAVLAAALSDEWTVGHEGSAAGTRFSYLERDDLDGPVVELIDLDTTTQSLMAHIASETVDWDGHTDAIHRLAR